MPIAPSWRWQEKFFIFKTSKKSFWIEIVVNAVYTRNQCPTRVLNSITLEEVWSGKRPCIAYMRVFRCVAYVIVPDVAMVRSMQNIQKIIFGLF